MLKDNVGRPPVSLGSKSMERDTFPLSALTLLVECQAGHPAGLAVGLLLVMMISLKLYTSHTPVVTISINIILSSNKVQNGDVLVSAHWLCTLADICQRHVTNTSANCQQQTVSLLVCQSNHTRRAHTRLMGVADLYNTYSDWSTVK